MSIRRILTTAAAGSFLMAVGAPAVQAADLGSTLASTALTAQTAGEQAGTATSGVMNQTGVAKKVTAVKNAVQAGADAVSAGNQLVNG
ncbi:hypothetical protein GA0115240_117011 [Streptomyces sp. DvalAA-14]|uniref:hypothetical protein n=1 Tax=unclassified Streptomyces TaxID=2593676 RepID=UPI00081B5D69|nr:MULTISPECIES: hypothetical protein [unclassified Streptomyces]MYS20149.1 hypothetical protein [Streptomyces sp. SID4948]SCD62030.1 hypothetical protein GA0115240_117011 [Streptomyces sp. DvalAA-14]